MYRSYLESGVLGKMAHLAMIGIGIIFVGPVALGLAAAALGVVVALLGVALPFIVIGALGYGPYLLVRWMFGKSERKAVANARRAIPESQPVPQPEIMLAVERRSPAPKERRPRSTIARVLGEVFCGALVGGVLGAVTVVGPVNDWQMSALLNYSALGAGIGAVVGFVVGGPRPTATEKSVTVV
jgi:hypothetical protein